MQPKVRDAACRALRCENQTGSQRRPVSSIRGLLSISDQQSAEHERVVVMLRRKRPDFAKRQQDLCRVDEAASASASASASAASSVGNSGGKLEAFLAPRSYNRAHTSFSLHTGGCRSKVVTARIAKHAGYETIMTRVG